MTPSEQAERERAKAAELAAWCDRMSIDSECGPYWQRQFRSIKECLTKLAALSEPAPAAHAQREHDSLCMSPAQVKTGTQALNTSNKQSAHAVEREALSDGRRILDGDDIQHTDTGMSG